MARRRQDEERSMDSLMDALTNVVGILLLILIISSLGMSQAIKVIVENLPKVTVEQLEQLKTIVDEQRKQMQTLRDSFTMQEDVTKEREDQETQVAMRIDEIEKENAELLKKVDDLAELERMIAEQEEFKKVNDAEVLAANRELADLRAILAQTPEREDEEAEIVRMPNPRLSTEQTQANYVICRHGKVYFVGNPYDHVFIIRDLLDREAAKLMYRGDQIGNRVSSVPGTRLNDRRTGFEALTDSVRREDRVIKELPFANVSLTEWNSSYQVSEGPLYPKLFGSDDRRDFPVYEFRLDPAKVGALFGDGVSAPEPYDGLNYHVARVGGSDRLGMEFSVDPEGGWTRDEFRRQGSELDKAFKVLSLQPNQLIYFYVAGDSFRAYLAARDMAEFYKLPAGWTTSRQDRMQFRATARMETTQITLRFPVQDYVTVAAQDGVKLASAAKAEIENFDANLAALKPPEDIAGKPAEVTKWREALKEERRIYIRQELQAWVRSIFVAAMVAHEADGRHEVGVDVHPPEIPHTRLFVPKSAPEKPKPPPDPNRPKPTTPADTTKLILD